MIHLFEVVNVKCAGCARSIDKALRAVAHVQSVAVDIERGMVSVEANAGTREALRGELLRLGYPEAGSLEGLQALAARSKSFVSCAVGRFGK
jgi:copper chaperone